MPMAMTETSQAENELTTVVTTALGISLALAIASDFLFWGYSLGASVAIWIGAVMSGLLLAKWRNASRGAVIRATAVSVLGALPGLETINALSLAFAALGLACAARILGDGDATRWPTSLFESIQLLCLAPFRIVPDLTAAHARGDQILPASNLKIWIMPVVFSALFLVLFAVANPLIETWIAALQVGKIFELASIARVLFWLAVTSLLWGLIQARSIRCAKTKKNLDDPSRDAKVDAAESLFAGLFSPAAILRALVLFNLLFAVQTGLDFAYLWTGSALPEGLSYAAYAHRGAYPLMVTAALAAVFVIASFGPGRDLENSSLERWLVFLWILQNIALVLSSIARLNLYVEVYALSYWRVAAFIWMGLVAVGLLLILVRIAAKKSNRWLVGSNLAVALAVLYMCCFVNFPSIIANYNVDHSREISGTGVRLDIGYIKSLGPQAIPARLSYATLPKNGATTGWPGRPPEICWWFDRWFKPDARDLKKRQQQWRSWTYRDYRLQQFINSYTSQC